LKLRRFLHSVGRSWLRPSAERQEGDDRTHRGCAAEVEHLQVKADDVHDHLGWFSRNVGCGEHGQLEIVDLPTEHGDVP